MTLKDIESRVADIAAQADRLLRITRGEARPSDAGLSRSAFLEKRAAEFKAAGDFKQADNYRATAALTRKCRPAPPRPYFGEDD